MSCVSFSKLKHTQMDIFSPVKAQLVKWICFVINPRFFYIFSATDKASGRWSI